MSTSRPTQTRNALMRDRSADWVKPCTRKVDGIQCTNTRDYPYSWCKLCMRAQAKVRAQKEERPGQSSSELQEVVLREAGSDLSAVPFHSWSRQGRDEVGALPLRKAPEQHEPEEAR